MTKTEKFSAISKKKLGAFLGAFDKYVEILCYFWEPFQRFGIIWKLFGAFLTNFEIAKNFLCVFFFFNWELFGSFFRCF